MKALTNVFSLAYDATSAPVPQRTVRRSRRRIALLAASILLLAGCSNSAGVNDYSAEVQTNYQQTCEDGSQSKLGADAATYCACTYDGFVRTVAFNEFKQFERYLRDNIGEGGIDERSDLQQEYGAIVAMLDSCDRGDA